MTTITKITFVCNTCGRKFEQEGSNTNRHSTMVAAQKDGWRWVSSDTQLCPEHASKNGNGKTAKAAKVANKGNGKAKVTLVGRKASKKSKTTKTAPAVGGQSIGKIARSAKTAAAPAAE